MKKNIWKVLMILGIIPFIVEICYGVYSSLFGFSGLCILNCGKMNRFEVFVDSIILYSYIFWPTYLIGGILIILSIMKLINNKRNINR